MRTSILTLGRAKESPLARCPLVVRRLLMPLFAVLLVVFLSPEKGSSNREPCS